MLAPRGGSRAAVVSPSFSPTFALVLEVTCCLLRLCSGFFLVFPTIGLGSCPFRSAELVITLFSTL